MDKDFDVLGASDEDFQKMTAAAPAPVPAAPAEPVVPPVEEESPEVPPVEAEEPPAAAPVETPAPTSEPVVPEPVAKEPPKEPVKEPTQSQVDYKAFHDRIMAPIKAAGKELQLKSVDEAITLIQKGADYARKTEELAKYRKYNMMLENAGLLDEEKLGLLIGLSKKEPGAIKRFLKQSNIDPVDIDTTGEDKYDSKQHVVTSQHAKLQGVIDDLKVQDGGQETLNLISSYIKEDERSKELITERPGLLQDLYNQKKSGVFAAITGEMERLKTLGQLPDDLPFLESYRHIGMELQKSGKLGGSTSAAPKTPPQVREKAPVTRRPASPTQPATTGKSDAAAAAAATRTTPKQVQAPLNLLGMSDEDFLKLSR